MRITLSFSFVAALSLFALPVSATGGCNAVGWGEDWFSDVRGCHSSYPAIKYMKDEGIVEGYPDGTYRPDAPINRAEFTKILMGVIDDDGRMCKIAPFSDAPLTEWYGQVVHKARCNGIIDGYPDGSFRPGNLINYAEAAKIAANAYGLPLGDVREGDDRWYAPYAKALLTKHAVPPTVDAFEQPLTRGEMAELIYRLETGKTSLEWFDMGVEGNGVDSAWIATPFGDELSFEFPGTLFSAKQDSISVPDIFMERGEHMVHALTLMHVYGGEGCNGMQGIGEWCRPSASETSISIGIVDRPVEYLRLGIGPIDRDITSLTVDDREGFSYSMGVDCEDVEYTFLPLDATRSVVIRRYYTCIEIDDPDFLTFDEQEALFKKMLDSFRFFTPYAEQSAPTMEISMLLCEYGRPYNPPTVLVPDVKMKKTVPKTTAVADATVRALLREDGEYQVSSGCPGVYVLQDVYRGVTVEDGVATVALAKSFKDIFPVPPFEKNDAASAQASVSANLKQFSSVQSVQFIVVP